MLLFVAQGFDRTEGCGAVGRVDPEEQADDDGHAEGQWNAVGGDHRLDADDAEAAAWSTVIVFWSLAVLLGIIFAALFPAFIS